jgi:hypothetical protein
MYYYLLRPIRRGPSESIYSRTAEGPRADEAIHPAVLDPATKDTMKRFFSELAVLVDQVFEHHPVSLELRQRHRHSDPARSGNRQGPPLRPRAHLRRREHLLRFKER